MNLQKGTVKQPNTVLFADVDNTLIYSYRHYYDGKVTWVESLNGHDQAYIPQAAFEALKKLKIELVPVSSRSVEQFNRITDFFKEIGVRRALINGGTLLKCIDGKNDDKTRLFNLSTLNDTILYSKNMEKAFGAINAISGIRNVFAALPAYISASHDTPQKVLYHLKKEGVGKDLKIRVEKNKIYIAPEIMTKGIQVKRFCEVFKTDYTICAGDSENDVSMLQEADFSICPPNISDLFLPRSRRAVIDGFFIDGIVDELKERDFL